MFETEIYSLVKSPLFQPVQHSNRAADIPFGPGGPGSPMPGIPGSPFAPGMPGKPR